MNVLIVHHRDENQHLVLPQVIEELERLGVRAKVVQDVEPQAKHWLWSLGQPTTVVSLRPLKRFVPKWATVLQQVKHNKIEESLLMEQVGLPVPKWTVIREGEVPDLSGFSDFVVVKPVAGCRGAFVRVMRRNRVRWRPLEIEERRSEVTDLIAQEYIHTGPWPTSYRVGMVFGEPIYVFKAMVDPSRPAFDENVKGSHFFEGRTIVSSSKNCTISEDVPAEVIEFAKRAHIAMPQIPVLAVDVIRDARTGKLFILEANSSGWSFMMTGDSATRIQREFGFNMREQFGGGKAVARGIFRHVTSQCWCRDSFVQPAALERSLACQSQ